MSVIGRACGFLVSPVSNAYALWNSADKHANITLSGGSLTTSFTSASGNWDGIRANIGKSSGIWYWEVKPTAAGSFCIGIATPASTFISAPYQIGGGAGSVGYREAGYNYEFSSSATSTSLATYSNGDVIGFTLDMNANTLKVRKNDTLIFTTSSIPAGTYYPGMSSGVGTNSTAVANFGASAFAYPSRPGTDGANAGIYN